jgi:P27 family predicted phage terminase small subunit
VAGNWNSGRRPQPTQLKVLRGNPGKRRLNPNEPKPAAAGEKFDVPPPELAGDTAAIAEWTRVAPLLRACGLVSEAERTALTALCQQWSRYLEAQANVRKLGMMVQGKDGVPMINPYLDVADRALSHCQRLWAVLGLTPAGRAKVGAALAGASRSGPVSKWEGLL